VAGSGGGGRIERRRPDRAVVAESARRRRGSGAGAVGRCGKGVLTRCDNDGASAMVGVELCGRPVPVAIRR
jgi:hypothetical protein